MTGLLIALGLVAVVGGFVALPALRAYRTYRGVRVVTCPEIRAPAAVEVDARGAAATALPGHPDLRLSSCSRWPEKEDCGQTCLAQIEASPEDCLLSRMLSAWYVGKDCAFCGWHFADIPWHDHRPALLTLEGDIVEWARVAPESVPLALATHRPVCWNCAVVETFRREHPELVIDWPAPPPSLHGRDYRSLRR